jgi:aldehyde dehydrogenase (NAD+)
MNALPRPKLVDAPARYEFGDLYIGGAWRPGSAGTTLKLVNPYNGDKLAEIPEANAEDVNDAYRVASDAQRIWGDFLPVQRADVMRRTAQIMEARRDEVVEWLIRESGSVRMKAEMEWQTVHSIVLESSTLPSRLSGQILGGDFPGKENRIYRRPVGVVAVISPWNWPMHLSTRSIMPALALGNAVVAKPANETPVTGGLLVAKILEEAGLPPGALNILVGPSKEIGDPFVLHPTPRVVSFTGSTAVGRHIGEMAISSPMIKKALLELGGNGPLLVLDDADLEQAVHLATVSKFLHQGQICMIANRIIVLERIHDEFVRRFVERVRTLKVGDPNDPQTVIGPVINQKQLNKLLGMVETAKQQGARLLLGDGASGLVLPPQVFDQVNQTMTLVGNDIFGPIAPIIRVKDEAEAIRVANDTEAGLTSAVLTGDLGRGSRVAHLIKAGMTHINDSIAIDMPTMPFGGEKNSGLGRFGTEGVIDSFTTQHWISVQLTPPQYPF